jgi:ADP-ribose pyrophosphatase YjhB (NUDIX family)
MAFSRKIYVIDKSLILTTNREDYLSQNPAAENYMVFEAATADTFSKAFRQLEKPGRNGVIIEDASADALLAQLDAMFEPIDAGGGLVRNEHNELLMIFRKGKWDLPKGKLDEGEDIASCSIREVQEETGLVKIELGEKICDTYHIYEQNKQQILKQTAWYNMTASSYEKLTPQKAENILEACWIGKEDLAGYLSKSYEAVREVFRMAGFA